MTIKDESEFYLFMDMRAEYAWASFNMTSRKWVAAAAEYNARLGVLNEKKNSPTVKKNPRALLDLLWEVERRIFDRIVRNDYVCKWLHDYHPIDTLTAQLFTSYKEQDRNILAQALWGRSPHQGRTCCGRQCWQNGMLRYFFIAVY
jgi:hypothetical protein